MAALDRPTKATYAVHEIVTVDTTDRRDHTFCGIVFPVRCKQTLPVNHIVINSISIRGRLGPLTVWVNKESGVQNHDNETQSENNSFRVARLSGGGRTVNSFSMKKKDWTKVYEREHKPSFREYCELSFPNPIIIKPDEVKGIYVHSTLESDEAIVYDNKKGEKTHDDDFISIYPGRAHVSEKTFGTIPIWGWGNPWRDNREFVGRLNYGVVYRLWNPVHHHSFGSRFQTAVQTLFACQRRDESPLSNLPDDCIFYILNMCRWDWVEDKAKGILIEQKKRVRMTKMKKQMEIEAATKDDSSEKIAPATSDITMATTCAKINEKKGTTNKNQNQNDNEMSQSDSDDMEDYNSSEDEDEPYQDHTGSSKFYYAYLDEFADSEDESDDCLLDRNAYNKRSWMLSRVQMIRALYGNTVTTNDSDSA